MRMRSLVLVAGLCAIISTSAYAGGPLLVGGPNHGIDGAPFTWASGVVTYRVDGGNFTNGVSNATGIARVQSMFSTWTSVPTASITATNLGPIQATGAFADGDVSTVAEFNAVSGSCDAGVQSPIIFDANGSIFDTLVGDPGVIGFAGPCATDNNGHIVTAIAMMNGSFQDGINNSSNFEITSAMFDEALTHEIGHFLGLDHSQINVSMLNNPACGTDAHAGMPLMFPYIVCNARTSYGLPKLSQDDMAWISRLYPGPSFNSTYGVIKGTVYFSDGITGVQGLNVIARSTTDLKRTATSAVSGLFLTGNFGQPFTGTNTGGSPFGSRNPIYEGYYELIVPAGTYRVEVESIDPAFSFGSSVGPLPVPVPNPGVNEFWDAQESANDDVENFTPITVSPGATVSGKDIILNGTQPRFDVLEEESRLFPPPDLAVRREEVA